MTEQLGWSELSQYAHVVTDRGTRGVHWWRACEPAAVRADFMRHVRGRSIYVHPIQHQPRTMWMCESCPWPATTTVIKRGDRARARLAGTQLNLDLRGPPDDEASDDTANVIRDDAHR